MAKQNYLKINFFPFKISVSGKPMYLQASSISRDDLSEHIGKLKSKSLNYRVKVFKDKNDKRKKYYALYSDTTGTIKKM